MRKIVTRYIAPALLAVTVPTALALAQAPPSQPAPEPPQHKGERPRLSDDAMKRLQEGRLEGRFATIKETLKLDDAQLRLWAPVEQEMRTAHAARQKAWSERRERRGQADATRPSLPDRLDRASRRMTERAQRMQAFTTAFKPFYEALSEEQKAVAGIVLREARGGLRGPGRRWAMEHWRGGRGGMPEGERPGTRQ